MNKEESREEALRRWRMVLGQASDPKEQENLQGEDQGMDDVLEALYDSENEGSLGNSAPNVNRWLGDIRKYFPSPVVQVMQKDALERLGLHEMLFEPELLRTLEVDIHLAATLINLQEIIPEKTRETARAVVRDLTEQLVKKLRAPIMQAIRGAIRRSIKNYRPRTNEIDWNKTILKNLKHYQPEYKTVIPEKLVGFGHRKNALRHVILLVDQSGSMSSSVVYASIIGAVLASIPALSTRFILFDTSVADMTAQMNDPVDLLFGAQLGGGTDINQAVAYTEQWITKPNETILFLISDLYEGGDEAELLNRIKVLKHRQVQIISLLALNDEGSPDYDKEMASSLAQMDIPAFACTPDLFPELIAEAIERKPVKSFLAKKGIAKK